MCVEGFLVYKGDKLIENPTNVRVSQMFGTI